VPCYFHIEHDARQLLEVASKVSNKPMSVIVTEALRDYLSALAQQHAKAA
jgi:hypothetical protein